MSKIVESYTDIINAYDSKANITRNVLSRYEKTKIIGMRLEQIARGAKPLVDLTNKKITNIREIVLLELEQRKIPFMIARTLPNGTQEYWKLEDMIIV